MPKRLELKGKKFGRLTVVAFSHSTGEVFWNCVCECGNEKVVRATHLSQGRIRSCGCVRDELLIVRRRRHGMKGTAIYGVWQGMKTRCLNPNSEKFHAYGGRGIKICERWMDFANFYADMGAAPPRCSLDRIDNDGDYEPSNCRWSTPKVQANNQRKRRHLENVTWPLREAAARTAAFLSLPG